MVNHEELRAELIECLKQVKLKPSYDDEQRDLQSHIKEAIDQFLKENYPNLTTVKSTGDKKPPIPTQVASLGTDFWPDIVIFDKDKALIALEIKRIKKGKDGKKDHSPAKPIEETLGQSLIYSLKYPATIALIINYGNYKKEKNTKDEDLIKLLLRNNIFLIYALVKDGKTQYTSV